MREGDIVTVCKLDWIARSSKHLLVIMEQLGKKGVAFKVFNINLDTSTPTGKLMLTMQCAIAEFERSLMLETQMEGIEKAPLLQELLQKNPQNHQASHRCRVGNRGG